MGFGGFFALTKASKTGKTAALQPAPAGDLRRPKAGKPISTPLFRKPCCSCQLKQRDIVHRVFIPGPQGAAVLPCCGGEQVIFQQIKRVSFKLKSVQHQRDFQGKTEGRWIASQLLNKPCSCTAAASKSSASLALASTMPPYSEALRRVW